MFNQNEAPLKFLVLGLISYEILYKLISSYPIYIKSNACLPKDIKCTL